MFEYGNLIILLASIGAFFMAFNNGANDVANAFASAVGSKAITMRFALIMASLVTFIGALALGGTVAAKLITGVVSPTEFPDPSTYIVAMIVVLLAAGTFVFISTLTGLPVSSSHSIVGSLIGVTVLVAGWDAVNWPLMTGIAASWVVSPFIAGGICYGVCTFIAKMIYRDGGQGTLNRVRIYMPWFVALIFVLALYFVLFQRVQIRIMTHTVLDEIIILVLIFGVAGWQMQKWIRHWLKEQQDNAEGAEKAFARLQVGTSCYVSFGIGANDVANSISPVFAIAIVLQMQQIPEEFGSNLPYWILILGGIGMATGISLLGGRVIRTLGEGITKINNSRGFGIDLSVASTVVGASVLGIPVSTSHAATGAVIGSGLQSDPKGVKFNTLGKIVIAWLVTVPAAALITMGYFKVAEVLFLSGGGAQ